MSMQTPYDAHSVRRITRQNEQTLSATESSMSLIKNIQQRDLHGQFEEQLYRRLGLHNVISATSHSKTTVIRCLLGAFLVKSSHDEPLTHEITHDLSHDNKLRFNV